MLQRDAQANIIIQPEQSVNPPSTVAVQWTCIIRKVADTDNVTANVHEG